MRDKRTLGIDEAGRGPAIGPMVMAAVCLDTRAARALTRAGLADSKSYGAGERARAIRAELADKVRARALHVQVQVIDVSVIDRRVAKSELNALEREVAETFILDAPPVDRVVADGKVMFAGLAARYEHMEACNDGESRHASVAAASVVAKVRRDQIFARICARYAPEFGEVRGGGYVNEATRRFLRAFVERHHCLPPEARRSWPHPYLADILGPDFDPFADCPDDRAGQLALL